MDDFGSGYFLIELSAGVSVRTKSRSTPPSVEESWTKICNRRQSSGRHRPRPRSQSRSSPRAWKPRSKLGFLATRAVMRTGLFPSASPRRSEPVRRAGRPKRPALRWRLARKRPASAARGRLLLATFSTICWLRNILNTSYDSAQARWIAAENFLRRRVVTNLSGAFALPSAARMQRAKIGLNTGESRGECKWLEGESVSTAAGRCLGAAWFGVRWTAGYSEGSSWWCLASVRSRLPGIGQMDGQDTQRDRPGGVRSVRSRLS